MHKFTTSTAEEREAHRSEVQDILLSMHETEVTVTSSTNRGFTFTVNGTFEVSIADKGLFAHYSVRTSELDARMDFTIHNVEAAWVTASGNIIRIDTHS